MLDDNIRAVYNSSNRIAWLAFRNNDNAKNYGYYYAESGVYLIRNMKTNMLYIVSALSPESAIEKLLEEAESSYKKGFTAGMKAACSLILDELKDQRFEVLDSKPEGYEIALDTIDKSINSVRSRLDKYSSQQ